MLTITVGFSHSGHKLIVSVGILLPANIISLTIGSCVSVRSSRYEARGKFREHER